MAGSPPDLGPYLTPPSSPEAGNVSCLSIIGMLVAGLFVALIVALALRLAVYLVLRRSRKWNEVSSPDTATGVAALTGIAAGIASFAIPNYLLFVNPELGEPVGGFAITPRTGCCGLVVLSVIIGLISTRGSIAARIPASVRGGSRVRFSKGVDALKPVAQ